MNASRPPYSMLNRTVSTTCPTGNSPSRTSQIAPRVSYYGKTPEGVYYIDRFNPRSRYHLSVGVSYPNEQDAALAAALGRQAGGDICPRHDEGRMERPGLDCHPQFVERTLRGHEPAG